jgi:uncharacterized protein YhbP (UPF0306 family)
MPIERLLQPIPGARISRLARDVLEGSALCAIATVTPRANAHVNTAYFAWNRELEIVWLSDPAATHSRSLRAASTVAIAVYDSHQTWGEKDRGIQLFGSAGEVAGASNQEVERLYARRFPRYSRSDFTGYRFYRFRPRRLKVFDERSLGPGVFVTASLRSGGQVVWQRTDVYRASA